MEINSIFGDETVIPRKALLKNSGKVGSAASTIQKKEFSRYAPLNNKGNLKLERDRSTSIRFLIGADALLDGQASFVSFRMKTNTFTAVTPSLHAMISSVTIRLPSCGNLIVERVESYNSLVIAEAVTHQNADELENSWNDGCNLIPDCVRPEAMRRHRRFLNLNDAGGWRTYTLPIKLSGLLNHDLYLPLSILGSLEIELEFAPLNQSFHFDPANEHQDRVFEMVDRMVMTQQAFNGLADAAAKQAAYEEIDQAFCGQQRAWQGGNAQDIALEVELDNIQFTACLVYPTQSYLDSMKAKLGSGSINILFDTYTLAKIPYSNSMYNSFTIQESIQNCKNVLSYCLRSDHINDPTEHSISRFYPFLRSYQLKIGGRLYERVSCSTRDNHEEVIDYTISKLSTGTFNKLKSNLIRYQTFGREHSIHLYPLETCLQENLNSGIETTAGMLLTYNCEYSVQNAIQIAGQAWADAIDPSTCELYVHLRHTQMLSISNQGVAVSK